jgi:hypothetical protein
MSAPMFASPVAALGAYQAWLLRQPLAPNTRRAYHGWVSQYCAFLPPHPDRGDPLADIYARDCAVHDFKTYLKLVQHRKPTSVNLALAALDHFYQFLGLGRPDVRREPLPWLSCVMERRSPTQIKHIDPVGNHPDSAYGTRVSKRNSFFARSDSPVWMCWVIPNDSWG